MLCCFIKDPGTSLIFNLNIFDFNLFGSHCDKLSFIDFCLVSEVFYMRDLYKVVNIFKYFRFEFSAIMNIFKYFRFEFSAII